MTATVGAYSPTLTGRSVAISVARDPLRCTMKQQQSISLRATSWHSAQAAFVRSRSIVKDGRKLCSSPAAVAAPLQESSTGRPYEAEQNNVLHRVLAVAPLVAPVTTLLGSLATLGVLQLPGACVTGLLACIPLLLHGVGPAVDALIGEKPMESQPATKRTLSSSALPLLFAVLHVAAVGAACVAGGAMWVQANWLQLALLGLSAGMCATFAYGAAHELVHSKIRADRMAAQVLLCWALHWPYSRSHPHHHLHVATPEDHTTALKGETLYSFIPRYYIGNYKVAWNEEAQEAARRKRSVWSMQNNMLCAMAAQVGCLALSWVLGGAGGLVVHVSAAAVGGTYLAAMDYLLHYGLVRARKADGAFSPISPHSSFSSAYLIENLLLFKVLVHWDHHVAAAKPYQSLGFSQDDIHTTQLARKLQAAEVAPRFLPGVPMMLASLAAFVPPLWFKLADPVSDAANKEHQTTTALPA